MDLELHDKRALVTGSSAGIGSAIANRRDGLDRAVLPQRGASPGLAGRVGGDRKGT